MGVIFQNSNRLQELKIVCCILHFVDIDHYAGDRM